MTSSPNTSHRLPLEKKLRWGAGGFPETIFSNALTLLALPIYNIGLGVPATWIALGLMVPRLLDTLLNPLIGNLSDNTRTRFGRRQPWIVAGGFLCALGFAALWQPSPHWSHVGLFAYFLVFSMVFYLGFDLFAISFNALGLELSSDYDERTRVQAWRMIFIGLGNLLAGWLYWMASTPLFSPGLSDGVPAEVIGMRALGIVAGVVLLVFMLLPATVRSGEEGGAVADRKASGLWKALSDTLRNLLFLRFMMLVITTFLGPLLLAPLGAYMIIYYVVPGDRQFAGVVLGAGNTVGAVLGLVSVPLITLMTNKVGKKSALMIGQGLIFFGGLSSWVLFTPEWPWLSLGAGILMGFGIPIFVMLFNSVLADICDADELACGERREGLFTGVSNLLNKITQALTVGLSGFVVALVGFVDGAELQSPESIFRLRLVYCLVPAAFALAGFLITMGFPLTPARVREIQAELSARRQ
jgi:GPH family glycoside/pentoside/hexuronide:cation symporter